MLLAHAQKPAKALFQIVGNIFKGGSNSPQRHCEVNKSTLKEQRRQVDYDDDADGGSVLADQLSYFLSPNFFKKEIPASSCTSVKKDIALQCLGLPSLALPVTLSVVLYRIFRPNANN
jgi:hypothetical protein